MKNTRRTFLKAAVSGWALAPVIATGAESALLTNIPFRKDVPETDTWDLTSLFQSDDAWKETLNATTQRLNEFALLEGKLNTPAHVLKYLRLDESIGQDAERITVYAYLRSSEDVGNAQAQELVSSSTAFSGAYAEAVSFVQPELLALDETTWQNILNAPELTLYRLKLERIAKAKPYTLSKAEEKILAQLTDIRQTASNAFNLLNNADLKFGQITTADGVVDLTIGSFTQLLNNPDRHIRHTAYHQFYTRYREHENTLGSLLSSSIQKDVFFAKVRKFPSSLDAALFAGEIPKTVYTNLITTVNKYLPVLHRYYELRRRKMDLADIGMYDVYIPILSDITVDYPWNKAVDTIGKALAPLGEEYVRVLTAGLTQDRWCDRYENKGKRSGAFSYGCFSANPYISINYKQNVIDGMFTLAHEGGHSMHSYYSAKMQPFVYYDYVTFVAEVASTFNEDMLSRYLLKSAEGSRRTWLINRQIDAIRQTLFRQTMFAEFEEKTHAEAEAGRPLSSKVLQEIYRKLLETYFGPKFTLDADSPLESLRVPHFYRAFYVYQYATSICASLELSQRITDDPSQAANYIKFLSGGCSKTPVELLKIAGVDMESPAPIEAAMKRFEGLVNELESLL